MRLSTSAPVVAVVAFATILASCSGSSTQAPTLTPTTRAVDAVAPLTAPPRLHFTMGALLQHYGRLDGVITIGGRAGDSVLVPLDATTGEPLPGRDPLLLHYATDPVVSPDGRTLALVSREGDIAAVQLVQLDPANAAALRLAEPTSWPDEEDPGFVVNLSALRWSPDGQHLYWLRSQHELWTLDTATGAGRRLATLEGTGWGPPLVSPDGRTIYALRRPCCDPLTEGDAFVIAIDARSGAEVRRVPLPRFVLRSPHTSLVVPPQARFQFEPAATLSPDGSRIYVVHADADLVTTVTTATRTAGEPASIGPRSAGSELPLIGRTVSARVSPNGHWLYVTGDEYVACPDDLHRTCAEGSPLGLQIIDTQLLTPVHHQPGIERIVATADERWLVGTGSVERWDNTAQEMVTQGFGLTILEADTGQPAASLERGKTIEEIAISPDSQYLYYVTAGEEIGCPTCLLLTVFDLERFEVVAERALGPRPVGLVSLAPGP